MFFNKKNVLLILMLIRIKLVFRNKQALIFQAVPSGQTERIGQQTDDAEEKHCQRCEKQKQTESRTQSAAIKS